MPLFLFSATIVPLIPITKVSSIKRNGVDYMIYFTSKHRVKRLSLLKKLWMTPSAYVLKYLAGGICYVADKFDEKVAFELVSLVKEKV